MAVEQTIQDVLATTDAVKMLAELRLQNSSEIPLPIWKMMANAEARLNREIQEYFKPAGGENARRADTNVG